MLPLMLQEANKGRVGRERNRKEEQHAKQKRRETSTGSKCRKDARQW